MMQLFDRPTEGASRWRQSRQAPRTRPRAGCCPAALYVINFADRQHPVAAPAGDERRPVPERHRAYGTAAGVFFLSYVLFQVPANAAL